MQNWRNFRHNIVFVRVFQGFLDSHFLEYTFMATMYLKIKKIYNQRSFYRIFFERCFPKKYANNFFLENRYGSPHFSL